MGKTTTDKVDGAIERVVSMFETGEMPEAIAETLISRAAGEVPSARWSLGNQLLMILAGTADARGFRQWESAGRKVKKGSKAFHILGPLARKVDDEATGEKVTRVYGFKGVPVFRYEDTEGEELDLPEYAPLALPRLADVAERLGVEVSYGPFAANLRGYYSPNQERIFLCSHDENVYWHELAHAAHAKIEPLKGGQDSYQEVVAETVAAVLCVLYGVEGYVAGSRSYIAAYAGESKSPAKAVMSALSMVQKVLDLIMNGPEEEENGNEQL